MIRDPGHFEGLDATINTTENCNLRCKYCYETCKTSKNISIKDCKKFIDYIASGKILEEMPATEEFNKNVTRGVILDFIGGDSLIDVDLLEEIFKYTTLKMAVRPKNLFPKGYRFNVCTNGTLFKFEKVRKFCERWKNNLSINVSIDGCPELHDLNRVYPNGEGSMKDILAYWPWLQKNFPTAAASTKSTLSRESIPYIYDSLKFMHEGLGMSYIPQNFIMEENHCTEEDYEMLEEQMQKSIEYLLIHKDDLYWSMIEDENTLKGSDKKDMSTSYCGSGWMPSLGISGDVYPCMRWLAPSQNGIDGVMKLGNINDDKLDFSNMYKVQEGSRRNNCSDEECKNCEFEHFCSFCIAGGYAEYGEFKRTKHICRITKIRAKYSKKYWEMYHENS